MLPGFLVKSLSDHYRSPGRLAEYKRQAKRAFRRPGDDLSVFAIELETLARRAFVDIDPLIQLRMVQDRFIDLRRSARSADTSIVWALIPPWRT